MSPPLPRFSKLKPSKRDVVMQAAEREFIARGFEGASLNSVISQAGISKGSFYYYFEDKLDLFITVLERLGRLEDYLEAARVLESSDSEEFWRRCDEMVALGIKRLAAKPERLALGQAFQGLSPDVLASDRVQAYLQDHTVWLEAMLTHGQRIDAVRDDLPVEILMELWGSVDRVFDRWFVREAASKDADGGNTGSTRVIWKGAIRVLYRIFSRPVMEEEVRIFD